MHTTFRVHPALAVCRQGPCGQRQLVHLRQSDLDGACGPHCLLMALQILGLASREPVAVDDGSPIDTSFPGFSRLMNELGGRIEAA